MDDEWSPCLSGVEKTLRIENETYRIEKRLPVLEIRSTVFEKHTQPGGAPPRARVETRLAAGRDAIT